jgi:uncharacterized membrane protein SirB2
MKLLILIHVLSAIIGVGPTFFGHILTRPTQSVQDLKSSYRFLKYLEAFPKIGGSLAVLSGIVLYLIGDYGPFTQLWIIGSLVLYVLIQIIVIAFITPKQNKVYNWLFNEENKDAEFLDLEILKAQKQVHFLFYVASGMGVLLFIFMILKPIVFG